MLIVNCAVPERHRGEMNLTVMHNFIIHALELSSLISLCAKCSQNLSAISISPHYFMVDVVSDLMSKFSCYIL